MKSKNREGGGSILELTWFMLIFSMGISLIVYEISWIFGEELPGKSSSNMDNMSREGALAFLTFIVSLALFSWYGMGCGYELNSLLVTFYSLGLCAKFVWKNIIEIENNVLHCVIAISCFIFWIWTCVISILALFWIFFVLYRET